jgi:ribonuclease T2
MWKNVGSLFLGIAHVLFAESLVEEPLQQMYVYAYSWTPGFCYQQEYPGCMDPQSYWETNFTIHGLWPQYTDNGYPSFCTKEPFDPIIPDQIGDTQMQQYWPNVQSDPNEPEYDDFWEHEWSKHGTCSGLTQTNYFENALALTNRIPTPTILTDSIGKNISASLLRNSFGSNANYVALQCKNQVLVGAYTCWNQTQNIPSVQVECPMSVVKEDTCANSENIIIMDLAKQN